MWNENYALLSYNEKHSKDSALYFAGDGYSLESGWLEPAMRGAINSVCHIIKILAEHSIMTLISIKPFLKPPIGLLCKTNWFFINKKRVSF